jgi:hypothetical protein
MKDREAFAGVASDIPWLGLIGTTEHAAKMKVAAMSNGDEFTIEPVVIVSKARYEALETCERIVHGRAIAMCEERGAEGETKEVSCG